MMGRVIALAASLRLTVVLMALAMVLIFVGTIAQTQLGVWQAVDSYFRAPIAWVDLSLLLPGTRAGGGPSVPMPGGLTIAALMMLNLLAAHAVRFKATRRRVGVLVLHAGLVLLIAGEFVTGFLADEGLMSIDEGQRTAFVEDIREVELAVIDPSDPRHDRVLTVPQSMLSGLPRGQKIDDPRLPFTIRIDEWMPNAVLFHAHEPTRATQGIGLEARAERRPRVTGVEGSSTDAPAAYVTLEHQGRPLGTWLVSSALAVTQRVDVDGKGYGLALRYRRTYLPYAIHLDDFRHDIFTGTNIARNFSSDVRIIDPAKPAERHVRIWMNNPLRYAGRTFYQASYKPDGSGTVLQVVHNPGWLMPYIACVLVGGGMLWHFGRTLVGFLQRRAGVARAAVVPAPAGPMRVWPWAVGVLGLMIACSALFRPGPQGEFDVRRFGEIPVSSGGRIKPMDTAARSLLMMAGGRQQIRTKDERMSATAYLLDLISRPERVASLPVVRVDHPDVLALLGRDPVDGGRLALTEIEPHWVKVTEHAQAAIALAARERDAYQKAVLQLYDRVNIILAHAHMHEPFAIPPTSEDGQWRPFSEAFLDAHAVADTPHPSVTYFIAMMTAASDGDAEGFERAAANYNALLDDAMPGVMRRARIEVWFNRASLFSGATAVYLLAFMGVCASFALRGRGEVNPWAERVRLCSWALLASAVLVHTVAIALRIYLQDRPPVTNLYSSAIFVGWAAALGGVFLERLYPLGVSILGSAVVGVGTLIIAHNLGSDGDTMQMMQAVLDSNFWLATHVITITLGYSATFLAGAIAMVYLLGRLCTRAIDREREQVLIRMIYGVVCFALLLSFVGTVLGGIWADQSWGRFWGWDPKENGAALVVLLNAIILHARWGGMARARGIAMLAVAGNVVTAWSWFGTNMLGVGLHSYGFMDSAAMWLVVFALLQLGLIGASVTLSSQAPRREADADASRG
ncbi:MAG: cytochrome c biogenesis protein CcsA [Phycisphaeraceae bacterium]|nr:cytochrome c biogenesis protein CcsA [Phycisphaeraceae bacterium]